MDAAVKAIQQTANRKVPRGKSSRLGTDAARWRKALLQASGSRASDRMSRLVILDKLRSATVTHLDVGVGVSQVLPILVNAASTRHHIHLIEQPELHLHPRLQANLADVFIDSALGENKNAFLLETHSEHLILRIMRRIRETTEGRLKKGQQPVRPSDVAIHYVDSTPTGSVVSEMPLNERGDLVKAWPGGFFEEGMRELLA